MNRTVFRTPVLALPLGLGAAMAVLAGCTANTASSGPGGAEPLEVTINGAQCEVSAAEVPSGTARFTLVNAGTEPNEFEILADDKLRIVGERENLGPGTTTDFTVVLEPGTYYTACKPNMVGEVTGVAEFTVTDSGEEIEVSEDEQALRDEAVVAYTAYVRDQVGALLTRTEEFTTAYTEGDRDLARYLYPRARMHYERIEPTAEAFGDIDPAIDLREADSQELGGEWTGWHVLEKDLWLPAGQRALSPEEGREMADALNRETRKLYDLVYAEDFTISLDEISNGAIALLEEVATTKITGEEEIFSHTDLYDIQANLEGASVAFGTVRDLAEQKDPELVAEIDSRVDSLASTLDGYRGGGDGFVPFTDLDAAERKQLSDAVNALRRPLATLTEVVVG
ncbi:iron uptake system protein EfeO [Dietzia sp. SYD-A1]|uniref:iron uptake system protein EfeO n=1 Tax=Dietzia sp. SYD-A1 TaxID=2780141 RepID=UPI002815E97C|nr:iron uptake system protein EfeO [Dietzia sp. SYD-A1]